MNAGLKEYSEQDLQDWLDEVYEPIEFAGMTLYAGETMKELDPVMFRCAMSDMPDVWICDECDTEFDEEDDANECCTELED